MTSASASESALLELDYFESHAALGRIINVMGDDIRGGRNFRDDSRYTGLLEGYACKTAPVSSRFHAEYFGYAMWYRRHIGKTGTLDAIQCFWPDKAGLFPDEAGCNPAIVQRQPRPQ